MTSPYRDPAVRDEPPRGPRWASEWQKVWVLLMRRVWWTREGKRHDEVEARRLLARRLSMLIAKPEWVAVMMERLSADRHVSLAVRREIAKLRDGLRAVTK